MTGEEFHESSSLAASFVSMPINRDERFDASVLFPLAVPRQAAILRHNATRLERSGAPEDTKGSAKDARAYRGQVRLLFVVFVVFSSDPEDREDSVRNGEAK